MQKISYTLSIQEDNIQTLFKTFNKIVTGYAALKNEEVNRENPLYIILDKDIGFACLGDHKQICITTGDADKFKNLITEINQILK